MRHDINVANKSLELDKQGPVWKLKVMVPKSHTLVLSGQVYLFPVVIIGKSSSLPVLDGAAHQYLLVNAMPTYSGSLAIIAIAKRFQSPRRLPFISSCTR